MERLPVVGSTIKDDSIRKFLLELVKSLINVLECTLYSVEVAWSEPMTLAVPLRYGGQRKTPPGIVRLADAYVKNAPETPVSFGATKWKWNGDGSVTVLHVDGLTLGTSYKLVFEVVG